MIDIYTAADSNYYTQVATLIQSLSESQEEMIEITVVGVGWSTAKMANLQKLSNAKLRIKFQEVDSSKFDDIKLSHGFPLATAYNLIGPKFYFSDKEKIIYLDADMLVVDSLTEVWNTQLDQVLAAVNDSHIGVIGNPSMWRPWRELDANPLAKYLNTGFMLINVSEWNRLQITEQCFDLMAKYEMPCIDQDALSLVINGKYTSLDPRFNMMPYHMMPKLRYSDLVDSNSEIKMAVTRPAVIHFHRSFFGKPWNVGCTHPYVKVWRNFADKADSKWKKKFVLTDIVKGKVARIIGMSDLDEVLKNLRV